MTMYKIVVHNHFGEFYPLGEDLQISEAMVDWYLYESDSATAKAITNPVNIIMLVEDEPDRCVHCGWPIQAGEDEVVWPWVHTTGFYGCLGRISLATKEDTA